MIGEGEGHMQSVVLASLLLGIGAGLVVVGMLGDLVSVNRKLLEKIDWRLRQVESRSDKEKNNELTPPGSVLHYTSTKDE